MSIRLVTFTDENMTISAERLRESALRNGVDEVDVFTPDDVDYVPFAFIINNLIDDSRGYGWWIWKPNILLQSIYAASDGDTLIYSDAGQEIVGDLRSMTDLMDEDIMFFTNGFQHSHWCKREVALEINPDNFKDELWDCENYDFNQVQASFILFKVNQKTRDFIQEWYAWSIMPGMIDNTPRGPQFPEFQEHRHDQAILTCLQIKYGYRLHWFPSTTNLHRQPPEIGPYDERYGIKINHHRLRNNEYP